MAPEKNVPTEIDLHPSTLEQYLPKNIKQGLRKAATVMIAGQPWNKGELPATVTTDKNKFLADLKATGHAAAIDKTSVVLVYLFLDMHGENNRPVCVVFDTGASISLWLSSAIKDGRLRAWLDEANPTTLTGVEAGHTQAQTATVIIPGNTKNGSGDYLSYISKSTIVSEIIAPLDTTDLCPLISSIRHTAADLITLPQDMTLANFQQDVGGTVDGLIGIKHIQEFPVHVFHLQNRLSISRHKLRPAGNRSKVFCLGGSLPALTEFKTQV